MVFTSLGKYSPYFRTQWPTASRSSFSYFSSFLFSVANHLLNFQFLQSFNFQNIHFSVFHKTPKSKFNSPVLISLKSFVRRKLIPVFDPRPLCCSSLTTAVGGTTNTNFVDFAHPTMARIKMAPLPGMVPNCK